VPRRANSLIKAGRSPRIRLVTYMGMQQGEHLIRHFLDHYSKLGVSDYLVILHSPISRSMRRTRVLRILREYGIKPRMEVADYTLNLRRERINEILSVHAEKSDWIVHADVDEFHDYPDGLEALAAECDAAKYTFVRGRWVDRLAIGGELRPIKRRPSIWEQFPLVADISSTVTGGWPLKVVLAKGCLRSGDGGTHSIDYGGTPDDNYHCSAIDHSSYPFLINIHHFKWDSTVLGRLRTRHTKYKSLGMSVCRESERLLFHIQRHGTIAIPDAAVMLPRCFGRKPQAPKSRPTHVD
jgi:hypothetical protein